MLNRTDENRHRRLAEAAQEDGVSIAEYLRRLVDISTASSQADNSKLSVLTQYQVDKYLTPALILKDELIHAVNKPLLDWVHYDRKEMIDMHCMSLIGNAEEAARRFNRIGFKPGLYLLNAGGPLHWKCGDGTIKESRAISRAQVLDTGETIELILISPNGTH